MIVTTIKQIENEVSKDSEKKESIYKEFEALLKTRNLKKGRIRPRDPIEAKILRSFNGK